MSSSSLNDALGRYSGVGLAKKDPVLSSFSPVGSTANNSRTRLDFLSTTNSENLTNPLPPLSSLIGSAGSNGPNNNNNNNNSVERPAILSQIKPRSATPTQSSAISRSVINATDTKSSRGAPPSEIDDSMLNGRRSAGRLSMLLKTPLTSTRRESLVGKEEAEVGHSTSLLFGRPLSSKPEEPIELGHADSQVKPLSSFLSPNDESKKPITSNERSSELAMNRFISRLTPEISQNDASQALESRKREEELPLTAIQVAPTKSDSLYRYKSFTAAPTALSTLSTDVASTTTAATIASSNTANRQSTSNNAQLIPPAKTATSSAGETAMNSLIRTLVEKNVAEAMSELRNDIHNLHVELIKQSLAQQTLLRQLVANVPESYLKIADENQSLREELERLKVSKGRF